MANIQSFFNKSTFAVDGLTQEFVIEPNVEFTAEFYITDILKGGTATAVSSVFITRDGRNTTELSDVAVWTAPEAQPDPIEPAVADPMWPVNVWNITATIADANWTEAKELAMVVSITDADGTITPITLVIHKV